MARGSYLTDCLVPSGARLNQMELNGARSNPRLQLELSRLGAIHTEPLSKATVLPHEPRPAPPVPPAVLATARQVLEHAGRPMPVSEIHSAAEELAGETLLRTSVEAALAAGASSERPRFRRVRHGVYESASPLGLDLPIHQR